MKNFFGLPAAGLLLSAFGCCFSNAAVALTLSPHLGQGWPFDSAPVEPADIEMPQLTVAQAIEPGHLTEIVAREALAMLGADYELGSAADDAVDCSSLMQRIFRAVGLAMPRTAREQSGVGEPVHRAELKKGDLLFYRWQPRNLHVAVYMDDGYILHASPSAGRVVLTRITPSWEQRLVAARRLI